MTDAPPPPFYFTSRVVKGTYWVEWCDGTSKRHQLRQVFTVELVGPREIESLKARDLDNRVELDTSERKLAGAVLHDPPIRVYETIGLGPEVSREAADHLVRRGIESARAFPVALTIEFRGRSYDVTARGSEYVVTTGGFRVHGRVAVASNGYLPLGDSPALEMAVAKALRKRDSEDRAAEKSAKKAWTRFR